MAKYKVGDRVRVISNPVPGRLYRMNEGGHSNTINSDMRKFAGKIVTIEDVMPSRLGYHVVECGYNWTDAMFEGLEDETEPFKYKVGDKVLVRPNLSDRKKYGHIGKNRDLCVTSEMMKLAGKVCTIEDIVMGYYRLAEDPFRHSWVDGMFKGLADPEPTNKRTKKKAEPKYKPVVEPNPFEGDLSWKNCLY